MDFRDGQDIGLKANLAIATSLPTRRPWLAPRNDKFFKRKVKKRWPVRSAEQLRPKSGKTMVGGVKGGA